MTGVIITWDEGEIRAIDDDSFESEVVDVIGDFFEKVEGTTEVSVEWKTENRDHNSQYKVASEPLVHLDRSRCFIDIVGQQRGGEYKLDLKPSGFEVQMKSTGQVEELTYLQLRAPGVAIDLEDQRAFIDGLSESIRDRLVQPIKNR